MRLYKYVLILILLGALIHLVHPAVQIEHLNGDVRIRRGMSETWEPARTGEELDLMDTILTGEGRVVLRRDDGSTFTLSSHCILDISELRRITRREMFLFVMSQKVQNIKASDDSSGIRISNVSAVHGEQQSVRVKKSTETWQLELNTANAMLNQELYPNSVVKCHKILTRYSEIHDCGTVRYTLARSFDRLGEAGQAIDHYQKAIEKGQQCDKQLDWIKQARSAIDRLSKEQGD